MPVKCMLTLDMLANLYKSKWKHFIGSLVGSFKPFSPPVINHCWEGTVVCVRLVTVCFSLVPDGSKYGHVQEGVDHGIPKY